MPTELVFLLPDDFRTFDIVQQQAIHIWTSKRTNNELILSYDHMQQIKAQFEMYPTRLQWIMDVGDGWSIKRNGKALTVSTTAKMCTDEHLNDNCLDADASIPWLIGGPESNQQNIGKTKDLYEIQFDSLPVNTNMSQITIKRTKDVCNLTFVPPWRKGRSAVKIKEFLRGQKVPLHSRDDSLVLCYSDGHSDYALAVYLEEKGEWIVHSDFEHDEGPVFKVVLTKKGEQTINEK